MKSHLWLLMFTLSTPAFAEPLDAPSQQALEQTLELLNNRHQRQKAVSGSQAARSAQNKALSLVGTEQNLDELYKISGEIFKTLVNQNGGDTEKMNSRLDRANQNPAQYYQTLTPAQKQMIKELADKLQSPPVSRD